MKNNINKNRKKCILNYKNLIFMKTPKLGIKRTTAIREMKKLYKNMINIQYIRIILKHRISPLTKIIESE